MCGFSALYSKKGVNVNEIKKMNDLIFHRGPDGEGYFLTEKELNNSYFSNVDELVGLKGDAKTYSAAIGHRRLSIVDLSINGLQPMVAEGGEHVIAFNGEIYNYLELKVELADAGYTFHSTSDTEVLLNAYLHWGKAVLEKLNGMFAFQIYNVKENTLFAARDRFGVKPFYYWEQNNQLALASEIKQFTCLPAWKSRLNPERAYDFLKFGQTEHTNETMFAGVYQLQPGCYFEVNLDDDIAINPIRWYQLTRPSSKQKNKMSFTEAKIKFQELFAKAVDIRLHADVPVGTGLSGGLDSSSIACEINALLKKSKNQGLQKTFSACTHVKKYNEKNYVDDVLSEIDAEPHFIYPEPPQDIASIDKMIWHQDEPFGTTSILAEWSVYKLAKQQGVKVTLDGHGADESLAGYHKFFFVYLAELLAKGNINRFTRELRALKRHHGYSTMRILKSVAYYYKNSSKEVISKESWFIPSLDEIKVMPAKLKLIDETIDQFSYSSVPMQMHWCDRDSMAHSVESRAPFLDVDLVEFIVANPSEYKINKGISKYILRESLQKLLPKSIYERIGKIGFATPEEEWLTSDSKDFFLSLLSDAEELTKGVLTAEAFVVAKQIINQEIPYNGFAWRIICFANWLKIFNVEVEGKAQC
ncbi:MAG: asparagine synthase (glutamine-hydrolyzing) [Colwellia sp.]|jgi:asparagine synthase (glutamine-hydrolysing)